MTTHEQARSDLRWIIAVTTVVVAIFGSTWLTTNVMITLAGVVREDLHELRDTLERAACGELAQVPPLGAGRRTD